MNHSNPRDEKRSSRKPNGRPPTYNWPLLEAQFLASDDAGVSAFFQRKFGVWTGWISKKTRGWSDKRDRFRENIAMETLERIKDKETREFAEILMGIHEELKRRTGSSKIKELDTYEFAKMWEIAMTLNGKPTRVTSNIEQYMPKPVETDEYLTPEEKAAERRLTNIFLKRQADAAEKRADEL